MEKHLDSLNSESLKVGLKIHKGKTKYMTNHADSRDILIDQEKKKEKKKTEVKYLGQTTHPKDTIKEEIYARIRAAWTPWSGFGKKKTPRKYSKMDNSQFHFKKKTKTNKQTKPRSNGPMCLANNDLWLPNILTYLLMPIAPSGA